MDGLAICLFLLYVLTQNDWRPQALPILSAMSAARSPHMPLTADSTLSPGSTVLKMAHSMAVWPVPLTARVMLFWVWNMYWIPLLMSFIIWDVKWANVSEKDRNIFMVLYPVDLNEWQTVSGCSFMSRLGIRLVDWQKINQKDFWKPSHFSHISHLRAFVIPVEGYLRCLNVSTWAC